MRRFAVVLPLICCALPVFAGPLNPPAGPITPTAKPLAQIEPRVVISGGTTPGDADSSFKITQAGSYYLQENLLGTSGRFGIEVSAPGPVTIDLNGFSVIGIAGALTGVHNATVNRLTVMNGTIASWPDYGVRPDRLDQVVVSSCGLGGVAAPDGSLITGCVIAGNGARGGYGVTLGNDSIVSDCIIRSNSGEAGGGGVSGGDRCQVVRCAILLNGTNVIGGASGYGVILGFDGVVADCRVNENGSSAGPNTGGVSCNSGAMITRCGVYGNRNVGLRGASQAWVAENSVGGTTTPGGAPGILIDGSRGRVEGNHVYDCSVGIRMAAGAQNGIVVRNSVRGGTVQYEIPAGNDVGPIGTAATATSPWANLQGP